MVDLAYRTFGRPDAAPLILLHGAGSPGHTWDAVAADLADTGRVYVPDLRGYGESPRPGVYSFELMRDDVLVRMSRWTTTGTCVR